MTGVEVLVRLAAADPWSFTVLDTLRRKLSLSEVVGVMRMKAWRLEVDGGNGRVTVDLANRLLKDTALLANPNRDRWFVREESEKPLPQSLWRRQKEALDAYVVKVTDREDQAGKSLLRVLNRRLGIRQVRDAGFSALWVIETSVGEPQSRATADLVAISRSWRKGLLSNPHFQDAQIIKAEVYLPYGEDRQDEVSA